MKKMFSRLSKYSLISILIIIGFLFLLMITATIILALNDLTSGR